MKGTQVHIAWKDLESAVKEFRGKRLRPVGVVQYSEPLFLTGIPDDGLAWEAFRDLTAAQVAEKVADARTRKWRPSLVHRHYDKPDCFALVLVENPHDESWEYHVPMTLLEYEKQLTEGRAKGLRPQYVQSWLANDVPTYSGLWVGDYKPAPQQFELAPLPRAVK